MKALRLPSPRFPALRPGPSAASLLPRALRCGDPGAVRLPFFSPQATRAFYATEMLLAVRASVARAALRG